MSELKLPPIRPKNRALIPFDPRILLQLLQGKVGIAGANLVSANNGAEIPIPEDMEFIATTVDRNTELIWFCVASESFGGMDDRGQLPKYDWGIVSELRT